MIDCHGDLLLVHNCWTYDPRCDGPKVIPFIPYPYQEEALLEIVAAIREKRQLLLRKVRDMGASWMCCIAMDHQAQFEPMCRFFMLSYVADLVDKPDNPKALFWKIDKIHEYLPRWMLDLDHDITRRAMGMVFHKTGSTVDGATTTARSGVGDRATAVFIDEFSWFDPVDAATVRGGLADVTPCRIWNFTINPTMGKLHPSYELVKQAKDGNLRCVEMHWRKHPEKCKGLYRVDRVSKKLTVLDKTYPFPRDYQFQLDGKFEYHSVWFDHERNDRANDTDVAANMELDWDHTGGTVFDEDVIVQHAHDFSRPPDVEGDILFDEDTGEPKIFVVASGGPIKLWRGLEIDGRMRPDEYVAGADVSLGLGRTNSCFSAGSVSTGEKVLEYADPHMRPDEFAVKCVALCRWLSYPDARCWFCWENSGPPGIAFGNKVQKLGYTAVYTFSGDDAVYGMSNRVPRARKAGYSAQKGHYSLLIQYQASLGKREFINRSKPALDETTDWVWNNGKPEHKGNANKKVDPSGARENHGDRVIADALCNKMRIDRGGGKSAIDKGQLILQGSMAWHQIQEKLAERTKEELYPDWNKKRIRFV